MPNKYSLVFLKEAEYDIQDAFDWYQQKNEKLGHQFMTEVENQIGFILNYPLTSPIKHKTYRQARVAKRFPFSIIYTILNQEILIISVFHASRNPKNWKNR
jgi:plasmid stabilization system protein ParE